MSSHFQLITGRALASRNYRLYFAGQLVSLAGTWMQQIAMSWLAYRLSGSAFVLGAIAFASQMPILFLGSFGGVWSDRFDQRRLMMWTQGLSLLQALCLAALAWSELATVPLLAGLGFLLGCINALDFPLRQAFTAQLIDNKADLPNAVALNSLLMNSARFVGPALAGFVVATFGEAVCFTINALSYLAVLLALNAIRIRPRGENTSSSLDAWRAGFVYVFGHREIGISLLAVAGISFLATPYAVLMPLIAREIFGGDARTYGFLIGMAGAGSLLAGLYLASRDGTERLDSRVAVATVAVGLLLALFSRVTHMALALPVLLALGFAIIITIAGSNTLIQTRVDDAFRGRVMAIFSMAFLGISPLGSLAIGGLAHAFGVQATLLACGLIVAVGGMFYRHHLHHDLPRTPPP